MKRSSGILLPVFSLPSNYGCGSLGKEAYNFINFLVEAKQTYWQMLPINHVGYGNSPYYCYSSFAGNPALIDLDLLKEDGMLDGFDLDSLDPGSDLTRVDYEKVNALKSKALHYAFEHRNIFEEFENFKNENSRWLKPYAEFMAKKDNDESEYHEFVQFIFYKQWYALKKYANDNGIKLIGDVPVYVPLDSADVMAEPEFFMLDEKNVPIEVAGVPPDYFNEEGQLWGNPLYNWEAMKNDGYGWWIRRMDGTLKLFDVVRMDHFRGFDSYWAVPYGETNAINGHWVQGPGIEFVHIMTSWFGQDKFIAEDLGILSESVRNLLRDSGLPGMRVLEFAFTKDKTSSYLPYRYDHNCICYTGTHDNAPVMAWVKEACEEELAFAREYCNCTNEDMNWGMIKVGMASVADLFVAQMQDYLGLDEKSRTNTPGTVGGNWEWRLKKDEASKELAKRIALLTENYGRAR